MPKDLVGAIANEGGLSARDIGAIKLFDSYSTVELPKTLSRPTLEALARTWVRGQKINLQPVEQETGRPKGPPKKRYGADPGTPPAKPRKKKVEGLVLPPSKYRKRKTSEPE
jgi:ATP-dependent RNA helicase DeaD